MLIGCNAVSLIGSTLDLDTGLLTLSFDGIINDTTTDCSAIQIASDDTNLILVIPLTNSNLSSSSVNTELVCDLGADKITLLETPGIATDRNNTFVIADNSGINDSMGIPVDTSDVLSTAPVPDKTRPTLSRSVLFDINNGILVLSFDDYINPSTLNFTELILQFDFDTDYSDPQLFYRLSEGTCTSQCENSDTLYINLTLADLNQIKLRLQLCTSKTDCVPTFSSFFVKDYANNTVKSAGNGQTNVAERLLFDFVPDTTPPDLDAFDIDLERDVLTLVFNEPVNVDTLELKFISLQGSRTDSTNSVTLSSSASADTSQIELILNLNSDKQLIKDSLFFNSENDTFLSLTSEAIEDVVGNLVSPILSDNALQVRNYTKDETPPFIVSFELDLDANSLTFLFSELIFVNSLINSLSSTVRSSKLSITR